MNELSRNEAIELSQVCFETLGHWTRMKVQEFVQQLLEEGVNALLRREKHDRRGRARPGRRQPGVVAARPGGGVPLRCVGMGAVPGPPAAVPVPGTAGPRQVAPGRTRLNGASLTEGPAPG